MKDERERAIADLEKMRAQSTEVEHEYTNLKIMVEKTKNQIEYLNSEKEKTGGF